MPAQLTLVTSDRPGTLVERLALDLDRDVPSPFDEEVVVVQSQGMARWLRHELARRHGCAASLDLPFPAAFAHRLAAALDDRSLDERFERDALAWRVLQLLEDGLADEPGFEPLAPLAAASDTRTRLGLATRVAGRLDDYQLYRPDVLLAWERGETVPADTPDVRWQAALWRRLCDGAEPPRHLARWFAGAIERLEHGALDTGLLPRRVAVFGVSTLPPLFVRLLRALARHVPVRAYLLAPPRATWGADDAGGAGAAPPNPLVAAFGAASRDLLALLAEGGAAVEEHHAADAAPPRTVLGRLQADVRDGVARGPEPGLAEPCALEPGDRSLAVHVCHSPMREMEVLRDQLLDAFAADPTLRPHDVLVLVPDVPLYAPFVEAVFGVGEPGLPRIPFHVADRPLVAESAIAGALVRLLRLVGARWTAAEIVELLDLPAVRRAAGIEAGATDRVLRWIEETRIRWGRDGAMRQERFGLPAVEANSWRAGIDRLLMGYAVGPADALVAGVLPAAGHTIGDPATLGALARWLDRLFDALDALREPRDLAAWNGALRALIAGFLQADGEDEAREVGYVLDAVDALARTGEAAGVRRTLDLAVVRDWLELALGGDGPGAGFLTGGMTVGALKPMRAIPFRVIALAGLDDATFPRRDRRAAHDLLAVEPRRGDPDRRTDDRQLFLDTLLAAGDRLVLSYVGRSAVSNTARAASVVVAELLDLLDRSFAHPAAGADGRPLRARDAIVVEHRLQPFSPAYFGGDPAARLFTYSRAHGRALAAARSADARAGRAAAPFLPAPLGEDGDAPLVVSLGELVACWSNPAHWFCRTVLQLRLTAEREPLDECEPLGVDALLRYGVQDAIVRRHLHDRRDAAAERELAVALGHLPPGELATRWFDRLDADVADFLETLGRPRHHEPQGIEIAGDGWTLVGRIDGITDEGRLQARPANCKPKDLLRAWVAHLALVAALGDVPPSRVVARDGITTFGAVEDPLALLDALVAGVRASRRGPIPVFERASHAYVERLLKLEGSPGAVVKSPLDVARDAYRGRDVADAPPGDRADPYVALCWRGRDPLAEEAAFARWSEVLWRPLLRAIVPNAEPAEAGA